MGDNKSMESKLTLAEARRILDRALEKGLEVGWISAYVIVDQGGNLISLSRLDGAPTSAAWVSWAKAYLVAVTSENSMVFGNRMHAQPEKYFAYRSILRRDIFPGPGAVPIIRNGQVVGGFSSTMSDHNYLNTNDFTSSKHGIHFERDGKHYSREDYVTAYALEIPYVDYHPHDR